MSFLITLKVLSMTKLLMDPYPYQEEDFRFLISFKKGALLHEPGVGKTFGALMALTYILEVKKGQGLVIMPPILLETWKESHLSESEMLGLDGKYLLTADLKFCS